MTASGAVRPCVLLARHSGTEVPGHGASPGTHLLFTSLEKALSRRYRVLRVPPYHYAMDARRSLAIAFDLLPQADVCLFALPPHPVDLDAFFLARTRSARQVPMVYMPLGEFPRGAWTYRHIHTWLGPADKMVFSSTADKAIYDGLVASSAPKSEIVHFGIDFGAFREARTRREITRRQLGIEADAPVFVTHGRIIPGKNVHGALMVFRQVAKVCPTARLWVVGALPEEGARGPGPRHVHQLTDSSAAGLFRSLLRQQGLAEKVLFWGAVSREALPDILGAADVALNLTLHEDENFGYSAVEAMACSLPVIGTAWGGLKDTVIHGRTGFLVPTCITKHGVGWDRWQALMHMTHLAADPDARRRMGDAAERHARRHFSLKRFTAGMSKMIDDTIAARVTAKSPHVWTTLGERIVGRYTATRPGIYGRMLARPVPLTDDKFVRHSLIRSVLSPYASPSWRARDPQKNAVYFLITELMQLRQNKLHSHDPRLSLDVGIKQPADRGIVSALLRHGFMAYTVLSEKVSLSGKPLDAALARLLRAGIVMQSVPA